jgi:hypothetical protein
MGFGALSIFVFGVQDRSIVQKDRIDKELRRTSILDWKLEYF